MEFTKDEKKQIRKCLKTLVKDMRELWKIYPYEDVKIAVDLDLPEYGYNWFLIMNKNSIVIQASSNKNYTNIERHHIHKLQDLIYSIGDYDAHFQFIKKYDDVRKRLESELKRRARNQQENIDTLTDINKRHSSKTKRQNKQLEATVQINLPNSLNAKEIKITEEDNKKIGVIDFGAQTIKIITEGNIILVNENKEQQKIKRR